ncbi:MAG TPA: hypothetical protein VEX60_12485 [Pyrinomonadaceae bacterium]|nr:hypothetical protein [Pyrinomonadaceae bacterium]
MTKRVGQSNSALVFVYNADSGLFNALADIAHKALSPQTYQCNLCALTHSAFGMRKDWKRFLETLDVPLEFLHADELTGLHGVTGVPLPAIFKREGERLKLWINADAINACRTTDDLKRLIREKLADAAGR